MPENEGGKMMVIKHTPGPWTTNRQLSRAGGSLGWIINHDNGRIGWSDYATTNPNKGESAPHLQGEVNAILMAAAPDMYKALMVIIKYAQGEYPRDQLADIEKVVSEAIAKVGDV